MTDMQSRLARLATRLLGASAGCVWVAGEQPTSPIEVLAARCSAGGAPLVVDDAGKASVDAGPGVGALLSVPSPPYADGGPLGAVCVWEAAPRRWTPEDVRALTDLAVSVAAEVTLLRTQQDLRVSAARAELALSAAGIGSFDFDPRTGALVWDERMLAMFGYTADTFTGTVADFERRVHPEDLPRVSEAVSTALATCGEYGCEHRVVLPDGAVRWVEARGRALAGPDGRAARLIGAGYDTTALHEGEARVTRVLETMPTAFYSLDKEARFTYVNAMAEKLLGRSREELLGRVVWDMFPAAVGTAFERGYRTSVETGRTKTLEAYYPAPLDRWYEMTGWPGPDGLSVYFHDITERRAAQQELERAAARSALFAEVASELSATLDAEEAVARLARLVVPTMARWSIVTLVDTEGDGPARERLRDIGWSHEDPDLLPVVQEYARLRLGALTPDGPLLRALRTGRAVSVERDATAHLAAALDSEAPLLPLRRLAPSDLVVVPLVAHGRTLGLMTLYDTVAGGPAQGRDGRRHHDLQAIQWVAGRAGLALDNARLYAQQRRTAEALQRSLLSKAPQPQDLQIAVRYQPAAEAAFAGGDWHDAFRPREGVTTVVIGDVVGHDLAAAAAMGQVRALLRGIAVTTQEGPAAVLDRLDSVLEVLEVSLVATAVVAELERTSADVARGGARLRWSSAGHPPPLVITPDGGVTELGATSGVPADLLLGVDRQYRRREHEAYLEPGATLLLFTDGLVERRRERYKVGLDRLREQIGPLARLDLEEMCDEVLARVLPSVPGDDVALAAVRVR